MAPASCKGLSTRHVVTQRKDKPLSWYRESTKRAYMTHFLKFMTEYPKLGTLRTKEIYSAHSLESGSSTLAPTESASGEGLLGYVTRRQKSKEGTGCMQEGPSQVRGLALLCNSSVRQELAHYRRASGTLAEGSSTYYLSYPHQGLPHRGLSSTTWILRVHTQGIARPKWQQAHRFW